MKQDRIDQALSALGFALKQERDENPLNNPMAFVERIPKRALTGDHINGGKIINFASQGITDTASKQQITVKDDGVTLTSLSVPEIKGNVNIEGTVSASHIDAKSAVLETLTVQNLKADIQFEKDTPIVFSGDTSGKGIIWKGKNYNKQFVFNTKPDKFFSSETIDINKGKALTINNIKVIDEYELGPTVTKSSLKEIGRLRNLVVDGSVTINDFFFYNSASDRIGLGTEDPNGALSVAEMGIEVMLGTSDNMKGMVGTFASHGFDIVTDDKARISISPSGNIDLGNSNSNPIKVNLHGKMSVGVNHMDTRADLDVSGPIKFENTLHMKASTPPTGGQFKVGDIVWNSNPQQRKHVGWVCTQSGSPGIWNPFGEIK